MGCSGRGAPLNANVRPHSEGAVGSDRYIFDIPIYRTTERRFNAQYDRDLKAFFKRIWPDGAKDRLPKETVMGAEQHFWETYGGPWTFNQVVGWVRLYVLGSQLRGELWLVRAKKLVRRPRHRQIPLIGKAFELHTRSEDSSQDIYQTVVAELKRFQKDFRGGRLMLNLECLLNVGPYIDWHALVYGAAKPMRSNIASQPTRRKRRAAERRR
jgi:hypothetical protein